MKNNVSILFSVIVIGMTITGCGPSQLATYDNQLYGAWHLYKVKKNNKLVPFDRGNFFFYPSGKLVYRDRADRMYEGTWAWYKTRKSDFAMNITVIDFKSHDVKVALFEKWTMTKKNEAKAKMWAGDEHNVFYFTRILSSKARQ
jgi:hypothetical protein